MNGVEIIPVPGVPEVRKGVDLGRLILAALSKAELGLKDGDAVVVKQKVVSKAEGRVVELSRVVPRRRAVLMAKEEKKDPRLVELILRESTAVVRRGHGVIITRTSHGFVCANSGVDQSNVGRGRAALLPLDPDRSARKIRSTLEKQTGARVAVIVSDTFGRPWRLGQTDVAIGCSGMAPLRSYAGMTDGSGYRLRVTQPAVADEVAGAAELATGKLEGIPVAIVRGVRYAPGDGGAREMVMPDRRDLFR